MTKTRKCKEKGCQGKIPQGKSLMAWFCRILGYCRYCYRMHYPKRPRIKLPVAEQLLSWSERRESEQIGFNTEVWSKAFCREMEDYWSAVMRGEIRI